MNIVVRSLIVALCFASAAPAQRTPELSLSETRIQSGSFVIVHGTGFTPNKYALSNLRSPDGTEFRVRRFLTDNKGEFFHRIDTSLLDLGTHELWAVDDSTKAVSTIVRFEVRLDP